MELEISVLVGCCVLLACALASRLKARRFIQALDRLPGPGSTSTGRVTRKDLLFLALKHGPLFAVKKDGPSQPPCVVLADGGLVREVLEKRHTKYQRRLLDTYADLAPLLGGALILDQGPHHRAMRSRLLPLFQPGQVDRVLGPAASAITDMLESWRGLPERTCTTVRRDVEWCVIRLAARAFLGCEIPQERAAAAVESLKAAMKALKGEADQGDAKVAPKARCGWRGVVQAWREPAARSAQNKLEQALTRLRAEVEWLLQEGAGAPEGQQTMGRLLQGEPAAVQCEQVVGLLFAVLNTCNELVEILGLMAATPAVQRVLLQEARCEAGVEARDSPTTEGVGKLAETRAFVLECLRLNPGIATFMVEAMEDDELGGHAIPRGARLMVSPALLHRHPGLWPEPGSMDPGRFALDGTELDGARSAQYMPFSLGPKSCIASRFAVTELTLLVASVADAFALRLLPLEDGGTADIDQALMVVERKKPAVQRE